MYPIILEIGPFTIYSLWVMVAIGFFTALLVIYKLVQKTRLKIKFFADYSLAIFLGGIILSRIVYIFYNWGAYFSSFNLAKFFQLFYIWDKGLSVWGGVAGILIATYYFSQKEGEDSIKWVDVMVTAILAGMVLINTGAFFDGVNYGNETNLPWGVTIETSIYAVPIHPTQLYAAIYCLLIATTLYILFDHDLGKKTGNISLFGLTAYSFFRFLEEFLRGDESIMIFGFRQAQILALLGLIVGCILLYVKNNKKHSS